MFNWPWAKKRAISAVKVCKVYDEDGVHIEQYPYVAPSHCSITHLDGRVELFFYILIHEDDTTKHYEKRLHRQAQEPR